ncbi:MAG: protein kinase [Planctomycetota bacterium]
MIRVTYERATELFQRALDLPVDERTRFIEAECEGDPEVLSIVRSLLRSDAEGSFLDQSLNVAAVNATDPLGRAETVVAVGEYVITSIIAKGTMGVVFLAEQASPRRNVALKLLAIGERETPSLLAEATLLGRLQHPGIARVYEAGSADATFKDGSTERATFIAMEHIEGVTLRDYIRDADLSRNDVASLLLRVTTAIEHAHRRGVIHRDLKPSNILVDPAGEPHIIDFGVGLLREDPNAVTDGESIAGTVAYMAPEQLIGRVEQADTRVDVYSIGVIAYELLTGAPPHQAAASIDEALLHRMRASGHDNHRALRRAAGRDFARVIARALSPDRDQRYASSSALADDLRCVLEGRPTSEDDSSAVRSLWMYARRHRVTAASLTGAFALCIAATAGLWMTSARARDAAIRADAATALTSTKALHAERIAEFLKTAFLGVDPEERGADVTLFEAIDYAAGRIHRDLADVPAVEADVRSAIGFVYRRQGRYADAFEQTRLAQRLHLELHGPHDDRSIGAAEELAYLTWIYEGDAGSALESFDRIITRLDAKGDNTAATKGWIHVKAGVIALAVDDLAVAEQHLAAAGPMLADAYGEVFAARPMRHRALVRLYAGQDDDAERLARSALDACLGAAEQEYIVARCLVTLGEVLTARGRYDEALDALSDAETRMARLTSTDGPDLARLHLVASRAEYKRGNTSAAVARADRAIETLEATVSQTHPELAAARAHQLMFKANDDPAPRERLTEAYEALDNAFGPDHRLSIASLRAAADHAESTNDDHAVRRLRATIEALERRRESRIGTELHRAHPHFWNL